MARLLTALGIPCGHETIFDYHGLAMARGRMNGNAPLRLSEVSTMKFGEQGATLLPTWLEDTSKIVAESSYMAAPFLQEELCDGAEIIHVVRNPIQVVNSFCHYLGFFGSNPRTFFEDFIYRHVLEVLTVDDQIERCVLFYILWNEMVEANSIGKVYNRLKVEDAPNNLASLLGKEELPHNIVPRDTNTFEKRGVRKLGLADIPSGDIKDRFVALADRYGYSKALGYII